VLIALPVHNNVIFLSPRIIRHSYCNIDPVLRRIVSATQYTIYNTILQVFRGTINVECVPYSHYTTIGFRYLHCVYMCYYLCSLLARYTFQIIWRLLWFIKICELRIVYNNALRLFSQTVVVPKKLYIYTPRWYCVTFEKIHSSS